MSNENLEPRSEPERQNNNPDGVQRSLTDTDIEELIRFFELLDEWDRQATSNRAVGEPPTSEHH